MTIFGVFVKLKLLKQLVGGDFLPSGKIQNEVVVYSVREGALIGVELLDKELTELTLPEGIIKIKEHAFFGLKAVKKIILPNSLVAIESDAFAFLEGLEEIAFSPNIKRIGARAFIKCVKLKQAIFSSGLEEIGANAFTECSSLELVYIPQTVKRVGEYLFLKCPILEIECQAQKLPALWSRNWNKFIRPVKWGVNR